MAAINPALGGSHIEGISDSARARELYKYYRPNATSLVQTPFDSLTAQEDYSFIEPNVRSDITSSKSSSPDTALTAFSQLVSWRLGTQRAMISVVDAETQYFIAESTKTLDLLDNTKHGPGDGLWVGCAEVDKAGRLCERTISLPPAPPGEYPAFVVNDLSQDDRFNQLPFVCGPPFLKFYGGTPLITKRGIPIGSLFVVDERVRNGLTRDEIHFMGTMASTIMHHLEMAREVEEHRRGVKMSRGLASFVEGRSELIEADVEGEDEGATVAGQFQDEKEMTSAISLSRRGSLAGSVTSSVASVERKEREYSHAMAKAEEVVISSVQHAAPPHSERQGLQAASRATSQDDISASGASPSVEFKPEAPGGSDHSESSAIKHLFSRAANLIREAFEVDGGSVFYDAQKGFSSEYSQDSSGDQYSDPANDRVGSDEMQLGGRLAQDDEIGDAVITQPSNLSPSGKLNRTFTRSSFGPSEKIVEVLGFSTPRASSIHGDELPGPHSFVTFDERSLHSFLQRYPRGKLWTFDEDGFVSSSDEDIKIVNRRKSPIISDRSIVASQKKKARAAREAKFLLEQFPGVRQLLFVPLWDAARSRWLSANFTWSNESTRILSKQGELAFLTAFGNSVMAECSRIDTEIADQKKGDFIGSISHELRSPLHGILASAEFLGEEIPDGFARGLVDTIDSCGRTLLDTINHVLDFSKVNQLEKNWRKSRRVGTSTSRHVPRHMNSLALEQANLPMVNLFADVDVAIVCEEVVEGVFAGHAFQNLTAQNFNMVADARDQMSDPKKYLSTADPMVGPEHQFHHPQVSVILDIDVDNYHFTTQPGALRRVMMNLLGNALKYTVHGYVLIKLRSTPMDDLYLPGSAETLARNCVTLTIIDTGKGISSDFLRSKLFTPFAQENSLSSGTGLGLSIVRSIVALLEGEIEIKSELGRGTEIRITLPLLRELPESANSTPRSASSIPAEADEIINHLRTQIVGRSAYLYGFETESEDPLVQQTLALQKASLTNFLSGWYGLKIVQKVMDADIIVANEVPDDVIKSLAQRKGKNNKDKAPIVLALCSHQSRFNRAYSPSNSTRPHVGYLAKPVGPLKLARSLVQCLNGIQGRLTGGISGSAGSQSSSIVATNDLSNIFEDLSMSAHSGEILDNSRMAAGSDNARKALESPTPNASQERKEEFPFPSSGESKPLSTTVPRSPMATVAASNIERTAKSIRLPPRSPASTPLPLSPLIDAPAPIFSQALRTTTTAPRKDRKLPSPRLLLVDDNKINLRLLNMYIKKRGYDVVDLAENGQEAVDKVINSFVVADAEGESGGGGYDVIFMDISMPVLDGFGATRKIREIERGRVGIEQQLGGAKPGGESRNEKGTERRGDRGTRSPALVIALTGLASSRDQSEAFTSGVDLFLTKPVAFKEVGKMLDNWEANREREVEKERGARV